MPIFDLFSKRSQSQKGQSNGDYLQYDNIPEKFRNQAIYILRRAIPEDAYVLLVHILREEYGRGQLARFNLGVMGKWSYQSEFEKFLFTTPDSEEALDAIELAIGHNFIYPHKRAEAIEEMNVRFVENSLGYKIDNYRLGNSPDYEYDNYRITRIDSEFIHSEAVKPAFVLLSENDYRGANDEFLKAMEHHRHGNNKDTINWALKAFESTMKTICEKRKWGNDTKKYTANKLIELMFKNKLVPDFWQTNMSSLRSLLEGGVPTGRNRLGGHGQGDEIVDVPQHIASYILHMTASTIVFLVESEKSLN